MFNRHSLQKNNKEILQLYTGYNCINEVSGILSIFYIYTYSRKINITHLY